MSSLPAFLFWGDLQIFSYSRINNPIFYEFQRIKTFQILRQGVQIVAFLLVAFSTFNLARVSEKKVAESFIEDYSHKRN